MNCTEVMALLDPLIDGELSKKDQANLDVHLGNCPDCLTELGKMRALQNSIKEAVAFAAPESLKAAIKIRIANEDKDEGSKSKPNWAWLKNLYNPVTTHAGVALLSGLLVFFLISQPFQLNKLHSDIFDAHMRSLTSENKVTVKSSDQHTVKPWFAGKVNYSPNVPDLKEVGFILLGGRIDRLQDTDIAVLTYLRRKHKIDVFITPIGKAKEVQTEPWNHNGYNVVFWRDKTFAYAAISDLSASELDVFSKKMNQD